MIGHRTPGSLRILATAAVLILGATLVAIGQAAASSSATDPEPVVQEAEGIEETTILDEMTRIASREFELHPPDGEDASSYPVLTVVEDKYQGSGLTALTLLRIQGGVWDVGSELSMAGPDSDVVAIGGSDGVATVSETSIRLVWPYPDGAIGQVTTRGLGFDLRELVEMALSQIRGSE